MERLKRALTLDGEWPEYAERFLPEEDCRFFPEYMARTVRALVCALRQAEAASTVQIFNATGTSPESILGAYMPESATESVDSMGDRRFRHISSGREFVGSECDGGWWLRRAEVPSEDGQFWNADDVRRYLEPVGEVRG